MKRKRILALICTIVMLLPVVALTGCGDFSLESIFGHIHSVDYDAYESDASGHWNVCSTCESKIAFRLHKYEAETSLTCQVCGYKRTFEDEPETPDPGEEPAPDPVPDPPPDPGSDPTPDPPSDDNKLAPAVSTAQLTDSYIKEHAVSTYGYEWLGTKANATKLQAYYGKLNAAADRVFAGGWTATPVDVSGNTYYYTEEVNDSGLSLTADEIKMVYNVFCYDHPYNFWQNQATVGVWSGANKYLYMLVLPEYKTYTNIVGAKSAINSNIRNIYAQTASAEYAYDAAAILYKAIALRGDYTYSSPGVPASDHWAHSIVGLLDNSTATGPVCESYARTFQLMLALRGVDNIYCVGTASGDGAGGGGGHAWNMVKLEDGNWYYFDMTWDDAECKADGTGGTVGYEYFAVSSADKPMGTKFFTETHTVGTPSSTSFFMYDLPSPIASTPYSERDFALGAIKSNGNFEYKRNGADTVAVYRINDTGSTVTVPSTVQLDGVTYTVTEIGPYINDTGRYAPVLKQNRMHVINIPATVGIICRAAFNCNWDITVNYGGSASDWDSVLLGSSAFMRTPTVNFA